MATARAESSLGVSWLNNFGSPLARQLSAVATDASNT